MKASYDSTFEQLRKAKDELTDVHSKQVCCKLCSAAWQILPEMRESYKILIMLFYQMNMLWQTHDRLMFHVGAESCRVCDVHFSDFRTLV